MDGNASLFARFGGILFRIADGIPVKAWIGVGCAALLGVLTFSVHTFRRAEVKL